MTTAAACVPTFRASPSIRFAKSSSSRTAGSVIVEFFEFVAFSQGFFQRDAQLVGHFGDHVIDRRNGHPQRAAHVADRRPGLQRAERADLRHVLHAVTLS